jgi:hypothetical protein
VTRSVSTKSTNLSPSVSGNTRRFPGLIATRNGIPRPPLPNSSQCRDSELPRHHQLYAMRQSAGRGENRVGQTGVLVYTNMDFYPIKPLVTLWGLMYLWPPFTGFVLVELGAKFKLASMNVPCFMAIPLCLR